MSNEKRFSIVWLVPLLIGFLMTTYGYSLLYMRIEDFAASQYIIWGSILFVSMFFYVLNPNLACFRLKLKSILIKLGIVQMILSGLVLFLMGYFGFPFPFLRLFTRFELGNLSSDVETKFFFTYFLYDILILVGSSVIIAAMKCRARKLPLKETTRL